MDIPLSGRYEQSVMYKQFLGTPNLIHSKFFHNNVLINNIVKCHHDNQHIFARFC